MIIWGVIVAVGFGVGAWLHSAGLLPWDALAPLHGSARWPSWSLLPAAVAAVVAVALFPVVSRRLSWPALLGVTWAATAGWAVVLATSDGGWSALSRPLTHWTEYPAGLPAMGDHPLAWLRGFTRALPAYPTHVKGHPPLPMLILWTMRWTGLGGVGWAAALLIGVGSSAAVAIAVTLRSLAGPETARRAVPFLVLSPTAVWVATSMDALFLGVAAWAVALLAVASSRRPQAGPLPPWGATPIQSSTLVETGDKRFHNLWITRIGRPRRPALRPRAEGGHVPLAKILPAPVSESGVLASAHRVPVYGSGALVAARTARVSRSGAILPAHSLPPPTCGVRVPAQSLAAFGSGVLLGALPYLSYGLLPIFALPLAVLILTRPRRLVLVALALGCAVVPAAFTLAGFSWWDGLRATHAAWAAAPGSYDRPYFYFLAGNLATLALLVGPATVRALPSATEDRVIGRLAGAALAGMLALDLAGVTRGEVERIWLPYAAWMTTATVTLVRGRAVAWLAAQAVVALVLQGFVRSPW